MQINKNTIDFLVFVSQTPDYRLPATAPLLQHRLGLPNTTAAFDVNLGCSGYVYGLSIAYAFAAQKEVRRVLLLVGDTPSKFVSQKDKTTGILFGDGGTATIIEKKADGGPACFSLNSDGSGKDALKIESGGYRNQSSPETLRMIEHEDGSTRRQEDLTMDGASIFNFTIREVPKDISTLIAHAGLSLEQIDYIIYHQANRFITDHLTKKLKYSLEKIPYSLGKYGNTTCLTIPLTIASELADEIRTDSKKVVLSGFGIGLSWATAVLELKNCCIPPIIEV